MTDAEIDRLATRVADRVFTLLRSFGQPATATPLPYKLTVEEFAWCIQRSAYTVSEHTRIDPKLKKLVQGRCPKLIHPSALALYGVDPALAAARLDLRNKQTSRRDVGHS